MRGGEKAAQVAREAGRHRGTVSRTVGRGRTKIAKEAKALYEVLQAQQGPGPLVVDLADGRVLEAVLSLLTPRQQLYLYLYYGEWLSLREIGRLLRVDHASVLRSIRCGLERLGTLAVGTRAEVRGLEELEERLMAHFNQLEPPEEALPGPRHRSGRPIPGGLGRGSPRGHGAAAGAGQGTRTAELGGRACAGRRGGRWGEREAAGRPGGWVERLPGRGRGKGGEAAEAGAACCSNCLNGSGGNCMLTIIEVGQGGRRPWPAEPEPPDGVLAGGVACRTAGAGADGLGLCGLLRPGLQDGKLVGLTPGSSRPSRSRAGPDAPVPHSHAGLCGHQHSHPGQLCPGHIRSVSHLGGGTGRRRGAA